MAQFKEALGELSKQLKAYCHAKECKRRGQCPRMCGCGKALGFDTAIAWEMSAKVNSLIFGSDYPGMQKFVTHFHHVAFFAYNVALYHEDDYEEFVCLMRDAYTLLSQLDCHYNNKDRSTIRLGGAYVPE